MRPLKQDVRDAFLEAARGRGVAAGEVWDYVKWPRYYLDFCDKYRREALDRDSLQAFLLKMASKNQSAEQQAQAARSVSLYLELAAPRTVAPAAPTPVSPRAAPPAQPRLPAWVKPAVIVGGARPDRVAEPAVPWPGSSPWDAVIVRSKEDMKLRQYSPKTFDAYAGWARQFAGFAGIPPDEIVMQDVKNFLTHMAVDARTRSTPGQQPDLLNWRAGRGKNAIDCAGEAQ